MHATQLSLSTFRRDDLVAAPSTASVLEAQDLTRRHGIHHLPIVEGDMLVGALCTCDLFTAPPDRLLDSLMKFPVTLHPEQNAADAIEVMRKESVGSVILVADGRPLGIVTRGDLLARFGPSQVDSGIDRCACCGVSEHLRTSDVGVLCVYCEGLKSTHGGALLASGGSRWS